MKWIIISIVCTRLLGIYDCSEAQVYDDRFVTLRECEKALAYYQKQAGLLRRPSFCRQEEQ